jgi:Tol biopolymer transport system component
VDGSERLQLTAPPLAGGFPRWSPDGTRIAFSAGANRSAFQVYLVPAAGGEPERILPEDGPPRKSQQWLPDWSPDGGSLLFGGSPIQWGDERPIRRLDLRTREVSTLPGSKAVMGPRWSPDGRYVAALSYDMLSLRLFDWETQRWETLVEGMTLERGSVWSRDGSHLYFQTADEDGMRISRIRIADRRVEPVADLGGVRRADPWFGLDPEGFILLARDAGIEEIYALDFEAP